VEDTDRERSTEEAVQVILDGMQWLGLAHDEGPYYQTRRLGRYAEVLEELLAQGNAYHCYCSKEELEEMRIGQVARKEKPRYDGRCRHRTTPLAGVPPVIRFKNPLAGEVVVEDLVHGPVVFQNSELDDLIIARSDGTPTYNFCVVVDDSDMHITHVIRGDDHLNNTPRQINMLRAIGFTPPAYAHVAMILGPDGAKLSKRHGAVSVLHYREEGYLPEALLNYLVRLGWSHGDQEIFSLDELVQLFDITDVNKAASAFNPEKLLWVNQQHMMRAPLPYLAGLLREQLQRLGVQTQDQTLLEGIVAGQRERSKTMKEMAENSRYFFGADIEIDDKAGRKHLAGEGATMLTRLRAGLHALSAWSAVGVHEVLTATATDAGVGLGKVAQPLRVALTGTAVSPPIDATAALIGRERVLQRLDRALQWAATLGSKA
jgi:glutamyl-tRNA synthetase